MSDVPQGPNWWQASDGRWYAPQPPPAPPPPPGYGPSPWYGSPPIPPPPPSSGTNVLVWVLVAVGVVLLLGMGACVALVVAVGEAAEDIDRSVTEERADEADDVSEPRCTSAGGFLTAEVDVTNDSSERSNYSIEVAFESADGDQIDTAFAFVSALQPGQSTVVDAQTLTEPPAPDFTCRVTDVERYSDEP